jgi:FtsP/CotA-like multicopper oxidase with cupredoxin domain
MMRLSLSRRRFLAATAAVVASVPIRHGRAADPTRLVVERRIIDIGGKPAGIFGIRRLDGFPGLFLDPGQRLGVALENRTDEPTIIHWHGQTPPAAQDGVTDTGYAAPILPGAARDYDFSARPGTHWMHSHHGLQEQLLMAAPLVVRTAEDLRADAQEVTVMLHDFSWRDPAELLTGLTGGAAMARAMPGHAMPGHATPGMAHAGGAMDLNDVEYDAYLANDRTLDDPLVVRTERDGRIRLRLINGATSTAFWIELGGRDGSLIAVDGNPVKPISLRRFPLAPGQRADVGLRLPAGSGAVAVLAQREGDRRRTGFILAPPGAAVAKVASTADAVAGPIDLSLERRLVAAAPLPARRADAVHRVGLTGSMRPYAWGIDGNSWEQRRRLKITRGQRVEIIFANNGPMAHPMHLHGHHFQVVALNSARLAGALRDTVLVPPNGTVSVAFDADNPGRWLLHCHNLLHMATGMMTEFFYDPVA